MNQGGATDDSSLLLTLEEISQLVAHSRDPAETLDNIVALIQGRFHTAVCSVYFFEPERGELVLGATVGLQREAVGRVRMRRGEGLTGLVAESMAPVMVADAPGHPRFKYFPGAGEDPYHSFLGVPLLEGGALQGVLVVQTVEAREFSPGEIRLLKTVAAQLAALVGDARLLRLVAAAAHSARPAPPDAGVAMTYLQGVPLSPGVGLGQAYVVDESDEWLRTIPRESTDLDAERRRLAEAMGRAEAEIAALSQRISELVGEHHGAILQAQLMIMRDRTIAQDLDACLADGASAEGALLTTLDKYVAAFQKVSTPFFQERVYDIKDVFHRLLWQLRPRRPAEPADDRIVLVAREASVMELFAVDHALLAGVVVEHGGPQSHAAILARSLGIPMVGQVDDFGALLRSGRRLWVDGAAGAVGLDPPADFSVPPRTDSGTRLGAQGTSLLPVPGARGPGLPQVEANVNLLYEAVIALRQGAVGVGLYRSEFLFLARRTLPTEDEQLGIYRKLLQMLEGRPVNIRTFDLRPDKLASYSYLGSAAARPFDWRLVLGSPPLQQMFQDQVRAILRAATQGPARILVPLVTSTELFDFVVETVVLARAALDREGLEYNPDVPLGVTIEVAAAVPLVSAWADQVAFFALGTNDLTASALGLDREDPVAAGLADPLHPGLLHLIHQVVRDAHEAGRPVTVCGEMAGDPLGALALSALAVDSLSVPVAQLASTRQVLADVTAQVLSELRVELLRQRSAKAVRALLQGWGWSKVKG